MIEFFQPIKDSTHEMEELISAPPSWAQFHYVALLVKDWRRQFLASPRPDSLTYCATIPNTSIETTWIDTRTEYGHLVEAYSAEPDLVAFYEMIANASMGSKVINQSEKTIFERKASGPATPYVL